MTTKHEPMATAQGGSDFPELYRTCLYCKGFGRDGLRYCDMCGGAGRLPILHPFLNAAELRKRAVARVRP